MVTWKKTLMTAILAVLFAATSASAVTWVWTDGDFPDADWDLVSWYPANDSGDSDATLSFTVAHGGNPDALRASGVALGGGPDDGAMIVMLNNTWILDPATSGPVSEIEGGLDFLKSTGGPSRIGLALQQGGEIFVKLLNPLAADTVWTTYHQSILTAADFAPIDPAETGQPDFSQGGAPMVFGFTVGQLAGDASGEIYFYQYVDNVLLVMNTGPISAVGPTAETALRPPVIHPNPFNPQTEISFAMPAEGFASLRIFDLSGRLVRTLAARRFDSGAQTAVWRGVDDAGAAAASGIYLAVLQTDRGRVSQRLTLAR